MKSGDIIKRCKQSYQGAYSNTRSDQEEYDESSGSAMAPYNPRPEGVKAAKARAKEKRKSKFSSTSYNVATEFTIPQPSQTQSDLARLADALAFSSFYDAYTKPTYGMDPETLCKHNIMCDFIEKKLGLASRNARNPPPSED